MTSISSLSKALPRPKYSGDDEQLPSARGPRIVDASSLQVTLRKSGPPPYGTRTGWRPRGPEDFGDGGAFPEVNVAQYPLDMGRKGSAKSNALAPQVDGEGNVRYDAIAKRGHAESRNIQSSFADLIPLRNRADAAQLSLERPDAETVEETRRQTEQALMGLVTGMTAAQNPKLVKANKREAPTYVQYTPSSGQMGDHTRENKQRIIKIVKRQEDPMAPPKHKHKKIPGRAPSPQAPILHSPPRKLTAEDQEAWRIPPSISNWKNPKGFTVALDKRMASNGRGLQDNTINDKFSHVSEALYMADRAAREEVQQRALMQQKLADKEKALQEDNLKKLAQKAREDKAALTARGGRRGRSRGRSSESSYGSDSGGYDESDDEATRERLRERKERQRERERELRMSKMGAESRMKALAREQGRDISEKIALGLAKPTATAESMYDSRLFNRDSGFAAGFNEDQVYDKPLFAAQEALNSIYRPQMQQDDEEDGADEALEKIRKAKRFDGFKDAKFAEARDGPVQFEKHSTVRGSVAGKEEDPYNIGDLIEDVTKGTKRKFGIQEEDGSKKKRERHDSDSD
jgi:SNW domain-containing protein 1